MVAARPARADPADGSLRRAARRRRDRRPGPLRADPRDRDRRRYGRHPPDAGVGHARSTTSRSTGSSLAVVTFIGGLFYGAAGYFLLGLVVWLGARGVGLETRGAESAPARRVRGAAVRALDPGHAPRRSCWASAYDWFRTGGSDAGAGHVVVVSVGLAFALWSLGLLALGLRTTFELPWRGVVGALALAAVIVAAIAVLPSVALSGRAGDAAPLLPTRRADAPQLGLERRELARPASRRCGPPPGSGAPGRRRRTPRPPAGSRSRAARTA